MADDLIINKEAFPYVKYQMENTEVPEGLRNALFDLIPKLREINIKKISEDIRNELDDLRSPNFSSKILSDFFPNDERLKLIKVFNLLFLLASLQGEEKRKMFNEECINWMSKQVDVLTADFNENLTEFTNK